VLLLIHLLLPGLLIHLFLPGLLVPLVLLIHLFLPGLLVPWLEWVNFQSQLREHRWLSAGPSVYREDPEPDYPRLWNYSALSPPPWL
jgi:hypothetical protein